METPQDRAVQAVCNVLDMTLYHLNELATKSHEASTQELARQEARRIALRIEALRS